MQGASGKKPAGKDTPAKTLAKTGTKASAKPGAKTGATAGRGKSKEISLAAALKIAHKTLGKDRGRSFETFLTQYYDHVPPQDLRSQSPENLFGAAHCHWKLAEKRQQGTPAIRVYIPSEKKDSWRSEHAIVEIVTDDMPFLVDSITDEFNRQGMAIHLVIHPILKVQRGPDGRLKSVIGPADPEAGVVTESWMQFQVDAQDNARLKEIKDRLAQVLADVRAAVEDWRPMRTRMAELIDELRTPPKGLQPEEVEEGREFCRWMHDNNFTFLGFREYRISGNGDAAKVSVARAGGLGLLREAKAPVFEPPEGIAGMPAQVRRFLSSPELMLITKTNDRTTVHRAVHMDAIGFKKFDAKGAVTGVRVFVGLFTSAAYNKSPRDIPLLRRKLHRTIERAGFPPTSHDGKALLNILENHPRDELFQISEDELFETSEGILHLQERQRVAFFVRVDAFERFISCLIFIPRDRYTMALRLRMQAILCDAFNGRVATFSTALGDAPLARLHMIVATETQIPDFDSEALEAELAEASRTWGDRLLQRLVKERGEQSGLALHRRYADAFGPGYQAQYDAADAMADMQVLEAVEGGEDIGLKLYRAPGSASHQVRFKIYHADMPVPLSNVLPLFEHMGFHVTNEHPHEIRFAPLTEGGEARSIFIQDFGLEAKNCLDVDVGGIRDKFEDAFRRIWSGQIESDGFNTLVACGGLSWREVVMLRAYCKCLKQMGIPYSQAYIEQTLITHLDFANTLVQLFNVRFDPAAGSKKLKQADREKKAAALRSAFISGLELVTSADEDRILSRFLNVMDATLRTSFFQKGAGGEPKPHVSFKLSSQDIDELPLPRPYREIFVYSPRIEGVHLRFGPVARGGLRWSDRLEDFRTEVLGLVKAQQVKNAVIVPVGSKGGFVVKQPPSEGGRDAFMAEGIDCYKTFISGLLDITDNLKGNKVVPPKDVVRWDDDDPYLVVAADKGTATFSDIANGVSIDYGHWLGDAFASGGSQGYDHKGMGITARGGWESVKRHFREMGVDTQTQDFTVVGVGDMSGDVFGNGMLLSQHIRLVAAFNHMHIFIDPDPDAAKGFKERKRLFETPRTTWADYDRKALSKGAQIFERSAKSVTLTPEIKRRFGIKADKMAPNDLLKAVLLAEVDLLWFGGIGTYIKAADEAHSDVGDRANDAIRVNGKELRCKVIGEGANLGATQKGRIEYALAGGRLNTDSIDNSAGVDCSDHEVNIKILVDAAVEQGRMSAKRRNALLAEMTDEVADLVLRHNYLQTQAITLIQSKGVQALENQSRLMRFLEREGRLDRAVEFLPDEEVLAERSTAKLGLTRSEISVLMSYAKIWLYDELLESGVPDDLYLDEELVNYFPTPLRKKFAKDLGVHRLKREIIATRITNSMVNHVGDTFVTEFMEKTGRTAPEIARAYTISRDVLGLRALWAEIEALDNKVPANAQTAMLTEIEHLLDWVTLWFLRKGNSGLDIGDHVKRFAPGMAALTADLSQVVPAHYIDDMKHRAQPYLKDGVPKDLAYRVAHLVNLYSGCDIVGLATRRKMDVSQVAKVYFAIGTRFRLGRLRAAASHLESDSHWQKLAVDALVEEIYGHQLALASRALDHAKPAKAKTNGAGDPAKAIETWMAKNREPVQQTEVLLNELWATEVNDLSMIAVASRQLRALADAQS